MRAVIYARYSTENQDARSIEDQERRCRTFAGSRGYAIERVYSDAGVSGTTTARPGLQQLLADARARRFGAVLVDDLSRLSRNRTDSAVLVRDLDDLGVRVVDTETGATSDEESSDVIFAVKGIVAGEYIKAIRRQTHRGLEGRALQGFATGGKTYGYGSKEEAKPSDPQHPRRIPIIDETEAAIVRRIFGDYARGQSPREIAVALNSECIPAPHDGGKGNKGARGWAHTTVRAMLRNERYTGVVTWNAYKWKRTANGTRRRVPRPATEHVRTTNAALAIVAPELWAKVEGRLGQRKASGRREPRVSSTFALSGLLRCDACGGSFGVVGQAKRDGKRWRTLGCGAHKDRRCPIGRTISERKVLTTLADYLREHLSKPNRVQKVLAALKARWRELEDEGSPAKAMTAQVEKQRRAVEVVTEALLTAPGSKALGDRLAAEERKLADLEGQLAATTAKRPSILPHPTAVVRFVEELRKALEGNDPAAAGRMLRRALAPFRMKWVEGTGYLMTGALDVSVCSEKVAGA